MLNITIFSLHSAKTKFRQMSIINSEWTWVWNRLRIEHYIRCHTYLSFWCQYASGEFYNTRKVQLLLSREKKSLWKKVLKAGLISRLCHMGWPSQFIPGGTAGGVWHQRSLSTLVKVPIKEHTLSTSNHECISAWLRRKIIWLKRIRNPQFLVKSNSTT